MADNNNNRKSKRKFSLEKPVERRFDIEKEFDAVLVAPAKETSAKSAISNQSTGKSTQSGFKTSKESVTQFDGNVPPIAPNGGDNNNDGGAGSKKGIIIALIIVALAACAYFFMVGGKSGVVTDPDTPQVEQNDSTKNEENANDSIVNATKESEGNAADDKQNSVDDVATNDKNAANKSEGRTASQSSDGIRTNPLKQSGVSNHSVSISPSSSIEQKAKDVWNGVYGNNPDRRKNLGSDYEEVQKLVNKMHRQGLK